VKIALCSTTVPFHKGGANQFLEWLDIALRQAGHEVEVVSIPAIESPSSIYRQMMAIRMLDVSAADLVICTRPQSHLVQHPNKVLWFIHHMRPFYDLWNSDLRGFPDDARHRALRDQIRACDTVGINEARLVFTNSAVVSRRLRDFNQVDSEVLYPPILHPERFSPTSYNDEIVYVSRLFPAKRQHLLVEALAHTKTPVRVRLVGTGGAGNPYANDLNATISRLGLVQRVTIDDRWTNDADKEAFVNNCLASAYFPIDEDSYGYPTLEAAHAHKPTLTTTDSGGVLEFAIDDVNAEITEAEPAALAAAMDRLFADRSRTRRLGAAANRRIAELDISWNRVLERLLS
jgi:glycosyltransferase involved in cell wall biosynthesis